MFSFLFAFMINIIAIVIANPTTATPVSERIICLKAGEVSSPKVASIDVSSVNIETHAEIKEIVFAVEYTGLLYFLYRTTFMIATVSVTKVKNAIAIVVIM